MVQRLLALKLCKLVEKNVRVRKIMFQSSKFTHCCSSAPLLTLLHMETHHHAL